jgi:predicted secreted protein
MAYTPASWTAGGLSPPNWLAAVANRSFIVWVCCSFTVLPVALLVAQKPSAATTTVPATPMIAATTVAFISGTYFGAIR